MDDQAVSADNTRKILLVDFPTQADLEKAKFILVVLRPTPLSLGVGLVQTLFAIDHLTPVVDSEQRPVAYQGWNADGLIVSFPAGLAWFLIGSSCAKYATEQELTEIENIEKLATIEDTTHSLSSNDARGYL